MMKLMEKESNFIREPSYWESRDAAGQEWRDMASHLESQLADVGDEELAAKRDALLESGDLDQAVKFDEKLNKIHTIKREAGLARSFAEEEARLKSSDVLTERQARFSNVRENAPSDEMRTVLDTHADELAPYIVDDVTAQRLVHTLKRYHGLDRETPVDKENISRYLHPETVERLPNQDRKTVNAARCGELLEAVLSTDAPDLRDLGFAVAVIEDTKNKYVRNLALKKTVEIIRALPESQHKVTVRDRALSPGLTRLYESTGSNLPKRDFLFTVPLAVKDGVLQEQLLATVERYHRDAKVRPGSDKEAIYFTAVVDLYNNEHPTELAPLLETLQRDQWFSDSAYGQRLREKNASRVAQGKPPLDRQLKLSHLRQAYQEMKRGVVEQKMPADFADIQNLAPADQGEFLDAAFNDTWQELSREEKRGYWDEEIAGLTAELAKEDLNRTDRFEDILKKLSAIRILDEESFREVLAESHPNLQELNAAVDQEQLALFGKTFEFTDEERQKLQALSNLPAEASMASARERLPELYRSFGNFNAPLILMERYRHGPYSKLKPAMLRENVVPLLKETMYHVAAGDFKDWRAGLDRSIQGAELEYRASDRELWELWHTDTESRSFEAPPSVDLVNGLAKEAPVNRHIIKDPRKYLLSPNLWQDPVAQRLLRHRNQEDFPERLSGLQQALKDRDEAALERFGLNAKDQASLGRMAKVLRGIEATESLCSFFAENDAATINARHEDLIPLLQQINPNTMLDSQREAVTPLEQSAAAGYRFLDKLKQALSRISAIKRERERGQISVVDSSDPRDLLTVGQQSRTIINCMSYEGDPNKNAYVLDIATSKNKKVVVVKENDRPAARAVLKLLRDNEDPNAEPIVVIDDLIVDPGQQVYSYRNEIIEHMKRKFAERPEVVVGTGIHDSDRRLEQLYSFRVQIDNGKISANDLTVEQRGELDTFRQNVLLAWSTGSRVSAELVETAAPGMPPQPAMKSESLRPRSRTLRTAFYKHFVTRE